MLRVALVTAAILLGSCSNETLSVPAQAEGADAGTMLLNRTTWEFEDGGQPTVITIDAAGNYIENRISGEHVVHGTYQQSNGKDCFTSAMSKKEVSCWTAVPRTAIGQTASAKSDNGQTATFKRIAYRELSIG